MCWMRGECVDCGDIGVGFEDMNCVCVLRWCVLGMK